MFVGDSSPLEHLTAALRNNLASAAGGAPWSKNLPTSRGPSSIDSYFHSQTLEVVLPAASTSYSKAPQPEPIAIFWELV
jgi:hypothetical protein